VGDAFRAGFLAAMAWHVGLERAAQVGCVLAAYVVETVGTQEYSFTAAQFLGRLEESYGPAAADDAEPHLKTLGWPRSRRTGPSRRTARARAPGRRSRRSRPRPRRPGRRTGSARTRAQCGSWRACRTGSSPAARCRPRRAARSPARPAPA